MKSTQTDLNANSVRPACPEKSRLGRARFGVLLAAGGFLLAACQALPPVVKTALVGFGQDVLAAAAQNFAPQYATSMQNLFLAMAETATGMPFSGQAESGEEQGGCAGDAYADDDGYAQETYDGGYEQGAYDGGGYAQGAYDEDGYTPDGYGQDAFAHHPYNNNHTDAGPAPAGQYEQAAGIALEVALLAQQRTPDGQVRMRPVHDGDILYDGRGDPARGDKIKIFFTANCACYVYVIGIDATGYVAKIFPDDNVHATSPVAAGARNLVPDGTTWWGLDDYRGIEQIYFIASRERRRDIEDLIAQLAGQRPRLPADYRPVREAAIVPMTRGLVQVQSTAPAAVPSEYGGEQQISPTLFQSTVADADLVITRWFRHE
jgi:hypothetical protein